jgi:hypothetical protein
MRPLARRTLVGISLLLTAAFGTGRAQTTYPNVKLNGRMQEQFYYFNNAPYAAAVGSKSDFFTRRARIEARGQISENVTVFLQPSFEGGRNLSSVTTTCTSSAVPATGGTPVITCKTTGRSGLRLRDAWAEVRFTPATSKTALYLRAGQEKRPYGRYELTSSNNLPSIERGAGQGLPGKASNNLFDDASFLSHDVGASVRVEHQLDDVRLATLKFGVYNGQGESLNDVNNAKSFGVRGTVGVYSKLDVGGSWGAHDKVLGADSTFRNYAWSGDAQWGKPGDEGLYVVGDYMQGGDNTASKFTMRGISLIGAYNYRLKSPTSWLYAIEPAFRYDYADPNTDGPNDRVTTITAVLGFYMSSKAQFRIAYERQSFQLSSLKSVDGLRSALTVNF